MYYCPMETLTTKPIRANRTNLGERSPYTIRVTPDERRQMQAIAEHRHWPESEAWRDAMRVYLREHDALLRLIASTNGRDGAAHE